MTRRAGARARWWLVVAFAIGMAWVEAASVYYLRVIADRVEPYQPNPLPLLENFQQVELVREVATLVMLLTVGLLAGRTWRTRLGYSSIAFGVWDIFYYVCLRLMSDWPKSLFDWDVLFLLPLPWWGPVLAPVCIALLMIVGGTLVSQYPNRRAVTPLTPTLWRLNWLGVALALYVFMADSIRAVPRGLEVTRTVLPTAFNWSVFVVALMLMAAPVAQTAWAMRPRRLDPQTGRFPARDS